MADSESTDQTLQARLEKLEQHAAADRAELARLRAQVAPELILAPIGGIVVRALGLSGTTL